MNPVQSRTHPPGTRKPGHVADVRTRGSIAAVGQEGDGEPFVYYYRR